MSRLMPKAEMLLQASDEERIKYVYTSHWIPYPAAEAIIAKLQWMLTFPKKNRMPCLLVVGQSDNGKSTLVTHFRNSVNPAADPEAELTEMPVALFEAPATPDERSLYVQLLNALHVPPRTAYGAEPLLSQLLTVLPQLGVKLIIGEEVHNTLACNAKQQRRFLNALKFLANQTQLPIVLTGTREAFNALDVDPQMATRFTPMWLPHWRNDRTYGKLLSSLERFLPLKNPSDIAKHPKLSESILAKSDGTIGSISMLLQQAAEAAITDKGETITSELIEKLHWIPLHERREYAMKAL
jgi:hypothetical protein